MGEHPDASEILITQRLVTRRTGFRRDEESVLAVDVVHINRITPLVRQARQLNAYPVRNLACFNVNFSGEFRYCLEDQNLDILVCSTCEIIPTLYEMAATAGVDEFKIRSIEDRQRSTPEFIEDIQRDYLERLDATQSPEVVFGHLERAIKALHSGDVAMERLVEQNRVSSYSMGLGWDRNLIRRGLDDTRVVVITDWFWRTPPPPFSSCKLVTKGWGEK
ncbi:DNA polymerase I [Natrinema versiforme JCM 10478]|uniref:DNA polymerase I n=1 Tax=Natrinema versiforme JCM 10478 TaxID=1227496 RepID=L9XWZ3_9EURY|nr:DNA polymerase I [Natrinema versiforme JCM 10478]